MGFNSVFKGLRGDINTVCTTVTWLFSIINKIGQYELFSVIKYNKDKNKNKNKNSGVS